MNVRIVLICSEMSLCMSGWCFLSQFSAAQRGLRKWWCRRASWELHSSWVLTHLQSLRLLLPVSQRCVLHLLCWLFLRLISLAGSSAHWGAPGINQGLSEFKRSDWTAHKFEASFEDRKLSLSFSSLIKISQDLTLTGTEDRWVNYCRGNGMWAFGGKKCGIWW